MYDISSQRAIPDPIVFSIALDIRDRENGAMLDCLGISRGGFAEIRTSPLLLAIVGHCHNAVMPRGGSSNLELSFMVAIPDYAEIGCE